MIDGFSTDALMPPEFHTSLAKLSAADEPGGTSGEEDSFQQKMARQRALLEAGSSFPSLSGDDSETGLENLFPDNAMDMEITGDVEGLLKSIDSGPEEGSFDGQIRVEMKYREHFDHMVEYSHQHMMGNLFSDIGEDPWEDDDTAGMSRNDLFTKKWETTLWVQRMEQQTRQMENIMGREELSEQERTKKLLKLVDRSIETGQSKILNDLESSSGFDASMLEFAERRTDRAGTALAEFVRKGLEKKVDDPPESLSNPSESSESDALALQARTAKIKSNLFDLI